MTCIVAKVVDGIIHMAGDKCGSNGYTKSISTRPKVFKNGDFLIGYTSSFRMGQILEFYWTPPERGEAESCEEYIYVKVIESFVKLFDEYKFDMALESGCFLFGYEGNLYMIQEDFAVFEGMDYAAVGCGQDEAAAVLFTFNNFEHDMDERSQLELAIAAAARAKVGVSEEYDYLNTEEEE
jgi:20S proteasome alpha/beta subunit